MMESLKEWAAVIGALNDGKQTVILRKGGIMETASGFKVKSKKFLLFPTYEHQEKSSIRPEFHRYLDAKHNDNMISITSYAEVLAEYDVSSHEKIDALSPFHIWSGEYISTRVNWMPERPLCAVFLRTFKIPEMSIPALDEYNGCRSWIEIDAHMQSGEQVLSDEQIDTKLEKFRGITG